MSDPRRVDFRPRWREGPAVLNGRASKALVGLLLGCVFAWALLASCETETELNARVDRDVEQRLMQHALGRGDTLTMIVRTSIQPVNQDSVVRAVQVAFTGPVDTDPSGRLVATAAIKGLARQYALPYRVVAADTAIFKVKGPTLWMGNVVHPCTCKVKVWLDDQGSYRATLLWPRDDGPHERPCEHSG